MKYININNDITRATLKKIYRVASFFNESLDKRTMTNQFMEDIDNDLISVDSLSFIINSIFDEKKNGGFIKSLDSFGTRSKKRFIKSKLVELLENTPSFDR